MKDSKKVDEINKDILNQYVEDKTLFRKAIKNCTSNKELYEFLLKITDIGGYKLYVPNKWDIPVEDIIICENGFIHCYFYMIGHRCYKSINGLAKVAELISCSSNYDTFTLDIYKKQ